jgi:hypothetical protein
MATDTKNQMVDIFIGTKKGRKPDGSTTTKNVYGRISQATADFIGVPADLRKTGKPGQKVTIAKGKAKGAVYEREIRGSRGSTYKLVYPVASAAKGALKTKQLSIGCPAGTPGTAMIQLVKKLTKKPQSVIYPSGKSHRVAQTTK